MFGTETSSYSNNAIRSVVPSPEIGDVRECRIENHQPVYQSKIDIVEGSAGSVVCILGQPVKSVIENVIISDETSVLVVKFSKTSTNGPIEEVITNFAVSINDSEAAINVNKKKSSVSSENPRRPLLETQL